MPFFFKFATHNKIRINRQCVGCQIGVSLHITSVGGTKLLLAVDLGVVSLMKAKGSKAL